ncbi:peptidoglycan DD-metalloendopeptidase family protein [Urechidicola sp. KH5]
MKLTKPQKYFHILLLLFVGTVGYSQTKAELEAERKAIQKEITTIRAILKRTETEEQNQLDVLNDLNIQIATQEKLLAAFKRESAALNSEINTNEKAIEKLEKELQTLKNDYADMIYRSYKSKSQQSRLMFVLSSDNFYQAYQRVQYMKQYTDFRKAQGEQIEIKAQDLEKKNDTLRVQKQEKTVLQDEAEEEKKVLDVEKQKQEKIITDIRKNEKKYKRDIKKKQAEQRKINAQIEKIIRDEIAKSNKGSGKKSSTSFKLSPEAKELAVKFESNQGKLPWPVERGVVSRRFGKQKHPTLSGIFIESNGVRITTSEGSEARAVFNGKVLRIQSVSGKKAVYVQHGNYITIYNNLEKVFVKPGYEVDTKQSIGTVYTDKVTKKTVLKFQLWKNITRLNPALWIYKL